MAIINNPNEKIFAEKMFQKMVELSQKSNKRLGISDFLAEYLSPEPEYPEEQEYPYSIYEKNEDARYRNKNNTSSRGQLLNEMKRQTKYKENFREKLSKRGK